jgi:cell division protein FtsB
MQEANRDSLIGEVEKILDIYLVDFQEEILKAALARIPQRRVAYNAEIDRDDAEGGLHTAVDSSALSLREQIAFYKKTKADFIKANRGRNVKRK